MLLSAGRTVQFNGLRTITPFMPDLKAEPRTERTMATFLDREHGLEWVLIPGGTVRAWGARERELLTQALKQMEGFHSEDLSVESLRPYNAEGFDFSRLFRPAVELAPFLTTTTPLLGTTRGLTPLDSKRQRLLQLENSESVFTVHRDELERLMSGPRWRLPSARESEWMTSAGQYLFPWGDELPRWMWHSQEFEDLAEEDPEAEEPESFDLHFRFDYAGGMEWACANGFGLMDALVASHWVNDDGKLSWHGGTGECYPWQACLEWAGLITAAVAPEPAETKPWRGHALRPVIELPVVRG